MRMFLMNFVILTSTFLFEREREELLKEIQKGVINTLHSNYISTNTTGHQSGLAKNYKND